MKHIPTVQVERDVLGSIGMLRIVEQAVSSAGKLVWLQVDRGARLLVLADRAHVRFWRERPDCFHKEVDRLPSSSAIGRLILGSSLSAAHDGDEWASLRAISA